MQGGSQEKRNLLAKKKKPIPGMCFYLEAADGRPPCGSAEHEALQLSMPMDLRSRPEANPPPGIHPVRLLTVTVVGNSMEPELRAHAAVRYLPTREVTDDGLYVFRLDGALKVKYLQRFAGGALGVIPRNALYEKELLLPIEEAPHLYRSQQTGLVGRLEVLGKVIHPAC